MYIDDFLVAAANNQDIIDVKDSLDREFKMNNLGTPRSFLSIEIEYHDDESISIHQEAYIRKILAEFYMEDYHLKSTLMNPKASLN